MKRESDFESSRRGVLRLLAGSAALVATGGVSFRAEAQTSLKIATVGAGREGGALGTAFAKAGHKVMFSSRHPEALRDLVASAGPNASAGTVEQAVAFGDVVLLVVPYTAVEQVGRDHGKVLAAKRLVMDISNPIPRRDGEDFVKSIDAQGGPGLMTAKFLPGAHIVRAFNAIGSAAVAADSNKSIGVPIAGDDPQAVALASGLIKEIGFEAVLVGGLAMGKYLRPGTPLAGEHSPAEIHQIAATLK